jgi:L-proline---[L-prolyl-carrier protein] ligase
MTYLLHQLLTQSANKWPDHEALRFDGQSLTYRELDHLSNKVARTLMGAGVTRGDRVGFYLNKSFGSIISIFGILKIGAVYVPMDPNAPAKRLAYMARNCDIKVLLTSEQKLPSLTGILDEGCPIKTIALVDSRDEHEGGILPEIELVFWRSILEQSVDPIPDQGVIETDLAYILYTSGSTGDPKGVMISHRTIFTFINWCQDTFHLTTEDRVTSHAPLHFDLSTFDIFVTIKAGGTIVLVPDKLSIFPIKLVHLLQDENITVSYMVPSILSLMVNYGKLAEHDLGSLRLILFAGEVFPIKYLRQLVENIPHADYYNLYGPTETNVCTYYKVHPIDLTEDRTYPVPIGRACENIEVFAVNNDGRRVTEPGEEGELWVRGSCVAMGYWGDPEKTSKTFVPNHFNPDFNEIAYRTGDLVSLDKDRINWRYIGRRDHMIKSRGYRIELGEIETVLYNFAGVKEAAVIAVPDDLIGNRLKAFIVPERSPGFTEKDLLAHCRDQLPLYMVPESIEFLDMLPKTSTGKINRPQLMAI